MFELAMSMLTDLFNLRKEEYGILVESIAENNQNILNVEKALTKAMLLIIEDDKLRSNYESKGNLRVKDFSYELWRNKHLIAFKQLI